MRTPCAVLLALAIIATQAAQASGRLTPPLVGQAVYVAVTPRLAPSSDDQASRVAAKPGPAASTATPEPVGIADPGKTKMQTQPQGQPAPAPRHRHTLRNVVIITVAVTVTYVILGAVAK